MARHALKGKKKIRMRKVRKDVRKREMEKAKKKEIERRVAAANAPTTQKLSDGALLSKKAETGFYRELASLTKSFMTFEARFLEAAPDEVRELSTAAFEPELTCQSDGDALLAIEGMQEGR